MSKTIGQKLRETIRERGLIQKWVAEKAGVPNTTLQAILDDRNESCRASDLAKIASVLGLSLDVLLGLKDEAS